MNFAQFFGNILNVYDNTENRYFDAFKNKEMKKKANIKMFFLNYFLRLQFRVSGILGNIFNRKHFGKI